MFSKIWHFIEGAAALPLGNLIGNLIDGGGAQIQNIHNPYVSMVASGAFLLVVKLIKDAARRSNIPVK